MRRRMARVLPAGGVSATETRALLLKLATPAAPRLSQVLRQLPAAAPLSLRASSQSSETLPVKPALKPPPLAARATTSRLVAAPATRVRMTPLVLAAGASLSKALKLAGASAASVTLVVLGPNSLVLPAVSVAVAVSASPTASTPAAKLSVPLKRPPLSATRAPR